MTRWGSISNIQEFKDAIKILQKNGEFKEVIGVLEDEIEQALEFEKWKREHPERVIHCRKCGMRMVICEGPGYEEVECPLKGCHTMTGIKGWLSMSGGRD